MAYSNKKRSKGHVEWITLMSSGNKSIENQAVGCFGEKRFSVICPGSSGVDHKCCDANRLNTFLYFSQQGIHVK